MKKLLRLKKGTLGDERGMILVLTLIFMLLGFAVIVPLLSLTATGIKTGMVYDDKASSLYAADAGIEDAMWQIKYEHLESCLNNPSVYNEFDYTTVWQYRMPERPNQKDVDVTVRNLWIPKDVPVPSESEARAIADGGQLMVTGGMVGGTTDSYHTTITYYAQAGENLNIEKIGVWLPPGFSYNTGSSSPEQDIDQDYYSVPVVTSHQGGQAVIWSFSSVPITSFPGVDLLDSPMNFEVSFSFTPDKPGTKPDAVSWVQTSGVDYLTFSWDFDVKVFKITSSSGETSVETYVAKSELRKLGGAFSGDYYATGNTLMEDAHYDSGHIRDRWLDPVNHSSSATVTALDEDAEVAAAYLYWTAWYQESEIINVSPLNPENCRYLSAWDVPGPNSWSVYQSGSNYYYTGHYSSGDNREITLASPLDLSVYPGAKAALCWEQKITRPSTAELFSDSCVNLDNWTAGTSWSTPSGQMSGHYVSGGDAERTITLTNPVDLSGLSGPVTLSWEQSRGGSLENEDALYFSVYNSATGWSSNIRAFRGNISTQTYNYTIPAEYITSEFRVRFFITGFAESGEYCYIDNIRITTNVTPVYSETDGLDFALYSSDTGWSSYIPAFRGDIGTSFQGYLYFLPPQYLTDSFRVRFRVADCADLGEYVCIDNIYLKIMLPDEQVFFKVNGKQVYYDSDGLPRQGTGELVADKSEVILNITSGVHKGFSYSCYKDVTALVKRYSNGADPDASPPAFGNGNGTYTVGHVDATLGIDGGDYQLAHAGWSLVIIYTSPATQGHQLYLYDRFTYADDKTDLDFDKDGLPGGNISGFIVPQRTKDSTGQLETNAATITCFVGEGDYWIEGDFLAFNAPEVYWDSDLSSYPPSAIPDSYKLWDQVDTPKSYSSEINNVWNGLSTVCSADGVDIDTFYITWDSGLISEGDTTAHIDLYTNDGNWNLIYMIISFRSETTTGGSLSYLIRG